MHEPRVGLAVVRSLFERVEIEIRACALNGRLCPSQLRRIGRRAARRISMVDESLLRGPADRGVRLVALSLLADAQKAGDRLTSASRGLYHGTAESNDALHDFRVAVRRLRSWIRAFKPSLRDAVPSKQRRRLSGSPMQRLRPGRVMWRLTKGRRVHKRRYSIRDVGDALWEVDEYLDRTLVVAEIELPSPDTVVELPPWLRAVMDREVTDEPEYANDHLAR